LRLAADVRLLNRRVNVAFRLSLRILDAARARNPIIRGRGRQTARRTDSWRSSPSKI